MDIDANDLRFLKKAILSNAAVLFLGAGFSTGAKNALGETIPDGNALAQALWNYIGYSEPYDGSDLQSVFQAALNKKKEGPLRTFLEERFVVDAIPDWYQIVARIFWFRIYTTNIDDLSEKMFLRTVGAPKLSTINGVLDDFQERDQLLESLQYIKLNGTVLGSPKDVTFSFRQYAIRSAQNDIWYDHFVRDYASNATIFIGTNLNEPLFWRAIETRGARFKDSENRPRSFLVSPHISPVKIDALREYHIVPIASTAKDFFQFLNKECDPLPERKAVLLKSNPRLDPLIVALGTQLSQSNKRHIQQFYTHFSVVSRPSKLPNYTKVFLQGAEPQWSDVLNDLDAPRQANEAALKLIRDQFEKGTAGMVAISGPAGTGKSTLLKRIAITLTTLGYPVFFSTSEEVPAAHDFAASLDLLPARSIIMLDNVGLAAGLLPDYAAAAARAKTPHTLVIAERTNKLDEFLSELRAHCPLIEYEVPNLSDSDIDPLIDILQKHHMLGRLTNKNRSEQREVFSRYARYQILVAMRRATLGDKFDQIIKDEFFDIQPLEAKMLYLCGCLASASQFSLSKQQLLACSTARPAEGLGYLARNLKNILVPTSPDSDRYVARHRVIAELIVEKLVFRSILKEAYIRLLQALAHDINFADPGHSASFKLYRRLINHTQIYQRFASDLAEARSIYDAIEPSVTRDFQFWLQYGSLELEYGELDTAANYIEQAHSYNAGDNLVLTTRALLLYKQSIAATSLEQATALRDVARDIIFTQIERRAKDSYPFHVYCSKEFAWINHWLPFPVEKKRALEDLKEFARKAAETHAASRDLQRIFKTVSDAYLDLAKPMTGIKSR